VQILPFTPRVHGSIGGLVVLHKMPIDNIVDFTYKNTSVTPEGIKVPMQLCEYPVKEVNMNGFHRAQSLKPATFV
jgi:hypothetical protein